MFELKTVVFVLENSKRTSRKTYYLTVYSASLLLLSKQWSKVLIYPPYNVWTDGLLQFGRTENIKNSLNPDFATTFEVDYYFEAVQQVRLQVYDIDNKSAELGDDDYLGGLECTLAQVRYRAYSAALYSYDVGAFSTYSNLTVSVVK